MMESSEEKFEPFRRKMENEGLPTIAIRSFRYYYERLLSGETGMVSEEEIQPIESLPDAEDLSKRERKAGEEALDQVVLLKLNGGLGTSMGLEKAKSLLVVKDELTFLDIIARQALQTEVPLVLMNSFATDQDSVELLDSYAELNPEVPLSFLQHKVPKIRQEDFLPVEYPADPSLEWCPPGHGDIYNALQTSKMLEKLLDAGKNYAFVSNSDNLGATLDPSILGFFTESGAPFMMEVADRSEADKKGGHLARLRGEGECLLLRESAQCPAEDEEQFQDTDRHRYFNTNNLWIDLRALKARLEEDERFLKLPMIRNSKTVNPRDPDSTAVYQLETAMGSAISVFPEAAALRVPRSRFAPVKTCNDLLVVRSDATILGQGYEIRSHPSRQAEAPPVVDLDPDYYKVISELEARFPGGPPSLLRCLSLEVKGDVLFEKGIRVIGEATVENRARKQATIPAGTTLEGHRDL